ncbi:hypothetical protein AB9D31_17690 [Citrobacter freundii]|uniref:hypothetical protein n=1 Tax=Citrobacter freundii TaxID=546 RepID=UPI0025C76727|nr:hypothetical protein [Citrobacter freundii]MDN4292760.1 hypothetical protein [Citrobacter freundii]
MKLDIQVDQRHLWQGHGINKNEAFRNELVAAINYRFGGELPDVLGKKLENLNVSVGDRSYIQVESSTANVDVVNQAVNDLIKTTLAQQSWKK